MCGRGVHVCDNGACEIVLCDKVVCVCARVVCDKEEEEGRRAGAEEKQEPHTMMIKMVPNTFCTASVSLPICPFLPTLNSGGAHAFTSTSACGIVFLPEAARLAWTLARVG